MSVDARRVRTKTALLMEQRKKANSSSLKKYNNRNNNGFPCFFVNLVIMGRGCGEGKSLLILLCNES